MPHAPSASRRPAHPVHPAVRFARATDHLHNAFRPLPFDPGMPHVAGSVDPDDIAALGGPVAELPPDLLVRFVLKAGTTWGGPADLRRVTPRLLELAADHQLPIDRALLWTKLSWAGWEAWPTHQARVVREFLHAEWRRLLCSPPRPAHLAHRWISDAAHGVSDVGPFFGIWLEELANRTHPSHHRAVTGHLVLLLTSSPIRPDFPRTLEHLFPTAPTAVERLRGFLLDDETLALLERAGALLEGTVDERRVRISIERLRRLRTRIATESSDPGAVRADAP